PPPFQSRDDRYAAAAPDARPGRGSRRPRTARRSDRRPRSRGRGHVQPRPPTDHQGDFRVSTTVLELTDVTFRRDGNPIIDGISLSVRAGEHWALLGPNGAGKSTLLGFCGALTHPTS